MLAAAAISGVLAVVENESFTDVIIILAVVIINAVLGVYQESKAEKAIEALQAMSATTLVCEVPVLANAFGFTSVNLAEYAVAIGLGLLVIPIVEVVKLFQRKFGKNI